MRPTRVVEQNIGGLQVAVENPSLVRVMDRAGNLDHDPGDRPEIGGQAASRLSEAAAGQERHGEVVQPLGLADLEDRHDVRVVERGDGLGLVFETEHVVLGGEPAFEDHLQRDEAAGFELPRTVDDPHASATDFAEQLVAGDDRGHAVLARDAVRRRPVALVFAEVDVRQRLVDLHLEPEPFGKLGEGSRSTRPGQAVRPVPRG